MSEIVLLGSEGEASCQGNLFDRTSDIEKALVAIIAIGAAFALTEMVFFAGAILTPFPGGTVVSRVAAFSVIITSFFATALPTQLMGFTF